MLSGLLSAGRAAGLKMQHDSTNARRLPLGALREYCPRASPKVGQTQPICLRTLIQIGPTLCMFCVIGPIWLRIRELTGQIRPNLATPHMEIARQMRPRHHFKHLSRNCALSVWRPGGELRTRCSFVRQHSLDSRQPPSAAEVCAENDPHMVCASVLGVRPNGDDAGDHER